jgi:protein-S-isoprenylcysteine O-methyltransferase Ste14
MSSYDATYEKHCVVHAGGIVNELLVVLDQRVSVGRRLWLFGIFVSVTLGMLAAGELLYQLTQNPIAVHILGWAVWLAWQGWVFRESNRPGRRDHGSQLYRQAFYRHIVPGVSFGVSQMARPLWHAAFVGGPGLSVPWQAAVALLCLGLGAFLLRSGFRTIGLARAGFVADYGATSLHLVRDGVYSYVRHPLFLGGVVASFGGGLLLASSAGLTIALVNLLVLPIYERLEDERMDFVFGEQYVAYRAEVGGVFPRPDATRRLISLCCQPVAWVANLERILSASN